MLFKELLPFLHPLIVGNYARLGWLAQVRLYKKIVVREVYTQIENHVVG